MAIDAFSCWEDVPQEHRDVYWVIMEAKAMVEVHPSKDAREFAKEVLSVLDKAIFRLDG